MMTNKHESDALGGAEHGLTPSVNVRDHTTAPQPGMVLGQYRLLEELGRGGFGRVYKAYHEVMNRLVALKIFRTELMEDKAARTCFRREVSACTRLNHPNIVMAYDANEIEGFLFLVMEYVDGPNLADHVKRHGRLQLTYAWQILFQTTLGLQYAHELGMVHRDIKPENLLLRDVQADEINPVFVKIADFGLARLHAKTTANNQTIPNEIGGFGTPAFVAPEQAENIHAADIRSDLYSLGCTFYYALSGVLPFDGKTHLEILTKQLKRDARPLELIRPDVPGSLATIIRRLMSKNPAMRYQTPADLLTDLSFMRGMESWNATTNMIAGAEEKPIDYRAAEPIIFKAADSPEEGYCEQSSAVPVRDEGALTRNAAAGLGHDDTVAQEEPATTPLELDTSWQAYWRQWFMVVEGLMKDKDARVHAGNYEETHRELIRVSSEQVSSNFGMTRDFYTKALFLAKPWLTSRALTALDRKSLGSLYEMCREIDARLGPRPAPWRNTIVCYWIAGFFLGAFLFTWWLWQQGITPLKGIP